MKNKHLKTYLSIGLLILLIVVIYPQRNGLENSIAELKKANLLYLFAAFISLATNYVGAALVYQNLSKKSLSFWRTLLVQGAGGFTNRLLPAGLGALGLNALYLVKNRYSVAQASALVFLNNLLGVIGNTLLLIILVIFNPIEINLGLTDRTSGDVFYVIAAFFILIGVVYYVPTLRRKVVQTARDIQKITSEYSRHPLRLIKALLSSILITLCHCGVLYFASRSVGSHVSLTGALIAISGGNLVGAATPTPGGLVGVEAGITASLVAQDITASSALAIALLYRFFTYWLPIIPGFIAFRVAQHKKLI